MFSFLNVCTQGLGGASCGPGAADAPPPAAVLPPPPATPPPAFPAHLAGINARVASFVTDATTLAAMGAACRGWREAAARRPCARLQTISGSDASLAAMATVCAGEQLAFCAGSCIKLWDLAGREVAHTLQGPSQASFVRMGALAALPDGRLATGSDDNLVLIWTKMSWSDEATRARAEPYGGNAGPRLLPACLVARLPGGGVSKSANLTEVSLQVISHPKSPVHTSM